MTEEPKETFTINAGKMVDRILKAQDHFVKRLNDANGRINQLERYDAFIERRMNDFERLREDLIERYEGNKRLERRIRTRMTKLENVVTGLVEHIDED